VGPVDRICCPSWTQIPKPALRLLSPLGRSLNRQLKPWPNKHGRQWRLWRVGSDPAAFFELLCLSAMVGECLGVPPRSLAEGGFVGARGRGRRRHPAGRVVAVAIRNPIARAQNPACLGPFTWRD
jgi:hypothetical protein